MKVPSRMANLCHTELMTLFISYLIKIWVNILIESKQTINVINAENIQERQSEIYSYYNIVYYNNMIELLYWIEPIENIIRSITYLTSSTRCVQWAESVRTGPNHSKDGTTPYANIQSA